MKNTHLSEKQLVGYVHRTITDAQRETMTRHLATCPRCRARLADHETLQRRINYSLLADLKTVHPSPQMTFAAIAPRLNRPKVSAWLWERSQRPLSGATALAALILQVVVLVALFAGMSQPVNGSTLTSGAADSNQPLITNNRDERPPNGWSTSGNLPQGYVVGVDHTITHGGRASGYVASQGANPMGYGALTQAIAADNYRGNRLRLSGYVKTEGVIGQASLWMRVDGPKGEIRQDKPVTGTTDWEKFEIILDVPRDSAEIAFGVSLEGKGRVWVDDFQLEAVSFSHPTRGIAGFQNLNYPQP